MIILLVLRLLLIVVAAGAFATFINQHQGMPDSLGQNSLLIFILMMGVVLGAIFADMTIRRKRVEDLSALYFGLLIGFMLSYMFQLALAPVFEQEFFAGHGSTYQNMVRILTSLLFPYWCISFLLQTKDDFRFIIPYVEFSRELKGGRPLVLDTSALIDGRIYDLVETKLVDARMIIPSFVIQELQEIAETNDKVRRGRGRRGLDILSKLQQSATTNIKIHNTPPHDDKLTTTRDQNLVEVARQFSGRIVTNDINLNKVASVLNVEVVNLNDVANSLKPKHLPGEQLRIRVMKEGEGMGQGVGYLDDGTMVVCEHGAAQIGREIDVEVTSVLQNSAGRMIFARYPVTAGHR